MKFLVRAGIAVLGLTLFVFSLRPVLAEETTTVYRPGEGITFSNEAGSFRLNLNFFGQIGAESLKRDRFVRNGPNNSDFNSVRNIGETQYTLFLRKLRFTARGKAFDPNLSFKIEVDLLGNDRGLRRGSMTLNEAIIGGGLPISFSLNEKDWDKDGRTLKLMDFYLEYSFSKAVRLRAGQFKVPFGRQELVSDYLLQMTGRSIASDFFAPKRDRGMMIFGTSETGRIGYSLGLFNGTGMELGRNLDKNLAYSLRLTATSSGPYLDIESVIDSPRRLHFQGGFAWYSSKDRFREDTPPTYLTDYKDTRMNAHFELFWRKYNLEIEGFSRKYELDPLDRPQLINLGCLRFFSDQRSTCEQRGLTAQAGMFFGNSHELALRTSKVDNDIDLDHDERTELTLSYTRFFRHHGLRWSTSITREKLGMYAAGSSGFLAILGKFPSSGGFTQPAPGYFQGLKDDNNTYIVSMIQFGF